MPVFFQENPLFDEENSNFGKTPVNFFNFCFKTITYYISMYKSKMQVLLLEFPLKI